ncbi:MAG: hypothetical protein JO170_06950 [Verrucomicrobia bacterium]|nr:hypothetical protein [Verrucomicrobiota bacterium]
MSSRTLLRVTIRARGLLVVAGRKNHHWFRNLVRMPKKRAGHTTANHNHNNLRLIVTYQDFAVN